MFLYRLHLYAAMPSAHSSIAINSTLKNVDRGNQFAGKTLKFQLFAASISTQKKIPFKTDYPLKNKLARLLGGDVER